MKSIKTSLLACILTCFCSPRTSVCDPRWTIPRFFEPPFAHDGSLVVEGTSVAPVFAWHASTDLRFAYDIGLSDRAHQTLWDMRFGLGLPGNLEICTGLPMGFTAGSKESPSLTGEERRYLGMSDDGFGIGDLRLGLLWSPLSASQGGLGVLMGLLASVPTGDHEKLMGEGGFSGEAFVSIAFQMLGARLSLNLGYRMRPEHKALMGERYFEQDDDLFWRFGVRVPRKKDIAWSLEAEGAIGVATSEGVWPNRDSRPVCIAGGVDFPLSRLYRMSLFAGIGPAGEAAPDFSIGIRFIWMPVVSDEDGDGVGGSADKCPLIPEDIDGFNDGDGCPELDNDGDGFADDEDKCPNEAASEDSEDGC